MGQYRFTIHWALLSAVLGSTRDVEMTERRSLHFRNPQLFRKDETFSEMLVIRGQPPVCPSPSTAESPPSPQAVTPESSLLPPVCAPAQTSSQKPSSSRHCYGNQCWAKPSSDALDVPDQIQTFTTLNGNHHRGHQMTMTHCDNWPKVQGMKPSTREGSGGQGASQ